MTSANNQGHSNVRVIADDAVPAEIRGIVASKIEKAIRPTAAGDFVQVTIGKRRNPDEIYDVRLAISGHEIQHDFQRGDLESERFEMWLHQEGGHLETNCWCGHRAEEHSLPQCTTCEV